MAGGLRTPGDVIGRVRADVERNALRARNGIKLVAGVGKPRLGQTPKDLVWSRGHAQLWRYRSDRVTLQPPLLIIFSLVSKSYVLDLQPGNSFVEHLQSAGFDVFLLDWREADERQAGERLEDYADGYLPEAVAHTGEAAGADTVNLFGYCYGGVLSLLYAAHHPDAALRSLTVMATPVDFSKWGLWRDLADHELPLDAILDEDGNVPASTIRQGFRLLKPTGEIRQYATLLDNVWNDAYVTAYQAMTGWSNDHVPFPGAAARQTLEMLVRDNGFVCDRVRLGGDLVRLSDIRFPLLTVIAERDHIVPEPVAAPLPELVGSEDNEVLRLDAGHVGLVVGRTAAKITIPRIIDFLKVRSEKVAR
ncbi:MAG: alpha/beta fold hydrolase [Solirubrobacterales bacterium]|nr:alpha/beta fold hydrolase [Solirubrobacterales bacterium]MBV9714530.1 alpha/beta fold hydrolase [Solirubrobacterales bacterium]